MRVSTNECDQRSKVEETKRWTKKVLKMIREKRVKIRRQRSLEDVFAGEKQGKGGRTGTIAYWGDLGSVAGPQSDLPCAKSQGVTRSHRQVTEKSSNWYDSVQTAPDFSLTLLHNGFCSLHSRALLPDSEHYCPLHYFDLTCFDLF